MLLTRLSSTRGKPNWCAIPRVKLNCPLLRSQGRTPQSSRLCNKFTDSFRNLAPTPEEAGRALEAMELITPLSENDIAHRSLQLFHVVIQAPVSPTPKRRYERPPSRHAQPLPVGKILAVG